MPTLEFIGESDFILLEEGTTEKDLITKIINKSDENDDQDAFYVADLGDVVRKHLNFLRALPSVKPFYAVKCNRSQGVLQTLAQLGIGFDCASKTEMELVLGLGVPADRILYANPCKQPSHIKYAAKNGVRMMTFDSEAELFKVSVSHPNARMILRIVSKDSSSSVPLSEKFGAPLKACRNLLEVAKKLKVEIIGVSFHVGSGFVDPQTFGQSIKDAQTVFALSKELGHHMHLLDIGGGFPGTLDAKAGFSQIADVINSALDKYFPEGSGVEIVAEPGRYYVASAFTLAVNVITKKEVPLEEPGNTRKEMERVGPEGEGHHGMKSFMYYVNDGLYGSFMHIIAEKPELKPIPHKDPFQDQPLYASTLWGPTSRGMDWIMKNASLPELQVGDWLIFNNLGAYSFEIGYTLNGLQLPRINYAMPMWAWNVIQLDPEALLQLSCSVEKSMPIL